MSDDKLAQALRALVMSVDAGGATLGAMADARQALSRYRSSVEGVELPEAEIACAVDEFDLIQDWSKSHLAPGVHYLYTATTVRTLIAQARLDEAEKALQWGGGHASDCAMHNAPAYEPGPCDCLPTPQMCRAAVEYMNGPDVYGGLPADALAIEEGIYAEIWKAMQAVAPSQSTLPPAPKG